VPIGGAFSDGAVQIGATVAAASVVASLFGIARFLWYVRDTLRDQAKTLKGIDKAVNHTPEGEPRLYDLVVQTAQRADEAAQQTKVLKMTVQRMQTQATRRDIEWSDAVLDLRGEVAKVQETLETLT
jgi:hypothetical protein